MNITHTRVPVAGTHQSVHTVTWLPEVHRATVVVSHGFQDAGFGVHRIFLRLASLLADKGIATVLFDYRGSGYSDGEFRDMTLSSEIADLKAVIGFAQQHIRNHKIGVFGHSLGGSVATALLAQGEIKIQSLVLWAALFDVPSKFNARVAASSEWRDMGDSVCHVATGYVLRKSMALDAARYDLMSGLSALSIPTLLIHGTLDAAVPLEQSQQAVHLLPNATLHVQEGATHSVRCQPEYESDLLNTTSNWFLKHLI